MSVTIKEIARLANVSRGTVDKVLNNRPGVKKETKERINKIIKELNYQPNIIGKALVQRNNPLKIEILLTPDYNPYIQDTIQGIKQGIEEFAPFGLEVSIKPLAYLAPEEQLKILSTYEASEDLSAIAIFPLIDERIRKQLDLLMEQGLPVITFNSPIPGFSPICHIGQDHYRAGRIVAELLAKQLPSTGKIGIISGSSKMTCHTERIRGFQDKLTEAYPNLSIKEIQENPDRRDIARLITLDYMKRYPDLNGIYITGGGVGGVGDALEELGLAKKVKIICHDVTSDSRDLLKKGLVDFVISQSSVEQGYQIVKTLFEYLFKKQTPSESYIEIPISIYIDELV